MEKENKKTPDMSHDIKFLTEWLTGFLMDAPDIFGSKSISTEEIEKMFKKGPEAKRQTDEIIIFLKDYKYIK